MAVLVTNQVMADPGNSMFIQDAKKAVGGHVRALPSSPPLATRSHPDLR